MKPPASVLITASFIFSVSSCAAQPSNGSADAITGTWKGTSLCQVRNSPCHDENVVYYFSKKNNSEDSFVLRANKIVNGKEEEMGDLDFAYDRTKHTLTCRMMNRNGRSGTWLFNIDGNKIHGTLTVEGNTLYRLVEVTKSRN